MDILLVHGAGGSAATWVDVAPLLVSAGHHVATVTNPLTSLADDVRHTANASRALAGPVLLVGHSYGGAVITNAGREPGVAGLVYLAAFAPNEGETVNGIVERYPPAEVSKHMRRGPDGEWTTEPSDAYWDEIGFDVPGALRASWGEHRTSANEIFSEQTGTPAWRSLPSWYLVASADRTLRPDVQRDMATRAGAAVAEIPGSHFLTRVHPAEVAAFVERAAGELTRR